MHATACLAAKNNCLAAKNKCLAESDRTRTESKATNKRLHPRHPRSADRGRVRQSHAGAVPLCVDLDGSEHQIFGAAPYGTVVVEDLGNNVARITENVTPNFILNTGNHMPLTFNLAAGGTIDTTSVKGLFAINSNPPFSNQPFGKDWQNAITGTCGSGGSNDGCGSVLTFLVNGFNGLNSSDVDINGITTAIFFAADIINVATASLAQ